MLKITKTSKRTENCNFSKRTDSITTYSTTGSVQLAGDSIWGYAGPNTVKVDSITVIESVFADEPADTYTLVNVTHNTTWDIYTDSAFESAISNVIGTPVAFTEQGMQDNNYASLEPVYA